jgi:hypothetical protein
MAEEQVNTRTEVLWCLGSSVQQVLVDPKPLVVGVSGLDAIAAAVLVAIAVKAVTLPATLLEESAYSSAARVLCVLVAVCHLHAPELHDGCDIGIYRAPGKQRPLALAAVFAVAVVSRRQAGRWDIVLAVVGKQRNRLS